MFAPIRPLMSTSQNNRDHRKILVIDGKAAYTGGVNLADEYINAKAKYGHWKDTAIKIEGEAVKSFTLMFLQMWNGSERGTEDYARYIRSGFWTKQRGSGFVMPYGDGPTMSENVAETIYLDIIHQAVRYIHIMTPYFIVDNAMLDAIQYAARRGVDVRIIIPQDMTASILARDNKVNMWVFGLNEENSIVNTLKGNFNGTKVSV